MFPKNNKFRLNSHFFVMLFSLSSMAIYGQSDDSKSLELPSLNIIGVSNQKFMVGQFVTNIDSTQINNQKLSNLQDFLPFQFPLTLKSYGYGQATTIALRGTSANHTAVLWNGININSPTLGQSDFSTIALSNFQNISVQLGAAGSTIGTDAIGGSIALNSEVYTYNMPLKLLLKIGSFQNYSGSVASSFYKKISSQWHISNHLQINYTALNNKFPYTSLGAFTIENSNTNQKSISNDLYFIGSKGKIISMNIWLNSNQLIIEPLVANSKDLREITQTSAWRYLGTYAAKAISLSAGYIRDIINYGQSGRINDYATTDRFLLKGSHEISLNNPIMITKRINIKYGGEISSYFAMVDGYETKPITENRGDVFTLIRLPISNKLLSAINIRQAFVTAYNPPLSPSIGLAFKFYEIPRNHLFSQIKLTTNIGKGYRVPTLNERYWRLLGKPDLQPETSVNKEIGFGITSKISTRTNSELQINIYHNLVENYIYWNPNKAFHVENLFSVLAEGMEVFYTLNYKQNALQAAIKMAYAYTKTSRQNAENANAAELIGKQLPYIPLHTLSANINLTYQQWGLYFQNLYYSKRFVNADNSGNAFSPYYLLNVLVSHQLKIKKNNIDVVLQGQNLSNSIYPNLKNNAMPGRNFSLSIYYKL